MCDIDEHVFNVNAISVLIQKLSYRMNLLHKMHVLKVRLHILFALSRMGKVVQGEPLKRESLLNTH